MTGIKTLFFPEGRRRRSGSRGGAVGMFERRGWRADCSLDVMYEGRITSFKNAVLHE